MEEDHVQTWPPDQSSLLGLNHLEHHFSIIYPESPWEASQGLLIIIEIYFYIYPFTVYKAFVHAPSCFSPIIALYGE